jgi:sec-independent protein translocase protein TatB
MFGMSFTEIIIIAVIAILFLGPDKLPKVMADIAKFFRNAKSAVGSFQDSLAEDVELKDVKEEALAYKKELLKTKNNLKNITDVELASFDEVEKNQLNNKIKEDK